MTGAIISFLITNIRTTISLGGKAEPGDEDELATAIREMNEEINEQLEKIAEPKFLISEAELRENIKKVGFDRKLSASTRINEKGGTISNELGRLVRYHYTFYKIELNRDQVRSLDSVTDLNLIKVKPNELKYYNCSPLVKEQIAKVENQGADYLSG